MGICLDRRPINVGLRSCGELAAAIAKASAAVAGPLLEFADVPVVEAFWETPHIENPFDVPTTEKVDMLVDLTATMQRVEGINLAYGMVAGWDTRKWFVSSIGHRIEQHIVEAGGFYTATAIGEHETQIRSYPQSFGQYETGATKRFGSGTTPIMPNALLKKQLPCLLRQRWRNVKRT